MSTRWYLVKRNWPQTNAIRPAFAGVGGDVWPLDGGLNATTNGVHRTLMSTRRHLQVGPWTELLCADRTQADAYRRETDRLGGGAWLLEVSWSADGDECVDGFDIGLPSGGVSLVEAELITQGHSGPPLNKWGLIDSREEAVMYIAAREQRADLEDVEGLGILGVRVLRHPGIA